MVNRQKLPSFVLPAIGVAEGVGFYCLLPSGTAPTAIILTGSCLVVVIGLLAWNNRITAKRVLAVPVAAASTRQPVLTVDLAEGLGLSEDPQVGFAEGASNSHLNR
jgi:hypothetical protein